jgi:hypothetical protein
VATVQRIAQDEAAFAGSGLKLATVNSPSWVTGLADLQTYRFGVVIAAVRNAGHGQQTLTLQLGELDDFADGPWQATEGASAFGMNF